MKSPLADLTTWMEEARAAGDAEPEAMVLATASAKGAPSARVVLCRGIDEGSLRFFTNYESRKAADLQENAHAAVVFYWASIGRQVRVEGVVQRLPDADSDAYFKGRPRGSQLSAWASPQSRAIESMEELARKRDELAERFEGEEVPRPPFWGGFVLRARTVEHWTRGKDRLHERVRFELEGGRWEATRVGP